MPGNNASSRDSAVIDDDLVESLGFEPLSGSKSGDSDRTKAVDGPVSDDDKDDSQTKSGSGDDIVANDVADPNLLDTQSEPAGALSDKALPDEPAGVDASSEDSSLPDAVSQKHSVVIIGDVTPVDAGDPVASDIAAAIFGSSDTNSESEEVATDMADVEEVSLPLSAFPEVGEAIDLTTDGIEPDDDLAVHDITKIDLEQAGTTDTAMPGSDLVFDNTELTETAPTTSNDSGSASSVAGATVSSGSKSSISEPSSAARPRQVKAKKSRRVIRHIDPWSILTFSVLFHLAIYAAFLLASVLVWKTLEASGMVENIEDFIIELGDYETYEINSDVLFKAAMIIAGILTVASTIMSVLLAVVFNLISDLVGGIRITVLEEETVRGSHTN